MDIVVAVSGIKEFLVFTCSDFGRWYFVYTTSKNFFRVVWIYFVNVQLIPTRVHCVQYGTDFVRRWRRIATY